MQLLQLLPYFEHSGLLPSHPCGYGAYHSPVTTLLSTESTLLSPLSASVVYSAVDKSLLTLFDVSSWLTMTFHSNTWRTVTPVDLEVPSSLTLVLLYMSDHSPKYLFHQIQHPLSATPLRPLRPSIWLDLFIYHVRTTMTKSTSFACIGPSLWNGLLWTLWRPSALCNLNLSLNLTLKPSFSLCIRKTSWEVLINDQAQYKYVKLSIFCLVFRGINFVLLLKICCCPCSIERFFLY